MLHKSKCCKNTTKTFGSLRFSRIFRVWVLFVFRFSFILWQLSKFLLIARCPGGQVDRRTSGAAAAAVTAATALAKVAIK